MKTIQLTKGAKAIVDDDDFERLNGFSWQFNGRYAARKENGKTILMHRCIMGFKNKYVTDHINGDKLDNRKDNLRVCTQSQNIANSKKSKLNTSGYKGVCYDKRLKRYRSYIRKDRIMYNLGLFATPELAHLAYAAKAIEFFGEFARLE